MISSQFGAPLNFLDPRTWSPQSPSPAAAPSGPSIPVSTPRSAPLRLQNALKGLGILRGDPKLSKLPVDGIIGPGTTKAVNYAIAQKYVVMPSFPRPELTVQHVRQFSAGIAAAVEDAVKQGGGKFPELPAASAKRSSGGGGGSGGTKAAASYVPPPEAPTFDRKWVMWIVGGASALLLLSVAAAAAKKRRTATAAA